MEGGGGQPSPFGPRHPLSPTVRPCRALSRSGYPDDIFFFIYDWFYSTPGLAQRQLQLSKLQAANVGMALTLTAQPFAAARDSIESCRSRSSLAQFGPQSRNRRQARQCAPLKRQSQSCSSNSGTQRRLRLSCCASAQASWRIRSAPSHPCWPTMDPHLPQSLCSSSLNLCPLAASAWCCWQAAWASAWG